MRYEIQEEGFDPLDHKYGMKIHFNKDVEVTTSHLTMDFLSLMSRIGGIIGVGQAFAWIILFCFDKIVILNNLINESK